MFSKDCIEADCYWYRIELQHRSAPHSHGCARLKCDPGLTKRACEVSHARIADRKLKFLHELYGKKN